MPVLDILQVKLTRKALAGRLWPTWGLPAFSLLPFTQVAPQTLSALGTLSAPQPRPPAHPILLFLETPLVS